MAIVRYRNMTHYIQLSIHLHDAVNMGVCYGRRGGEKTADYHSTNSDIGYHDTLHSSWKLRHVTEVHVITTGWGESSS
jgi:hypothetical protein